MRDKRLTVKDARLLAGLSQAEVAENLGLCRHTYRKYEANPKLMPIGLSEKFSFIVERDYGEIFFTSTSTDSRNIETYDIHPMPDFLPIAETERLYPQTNYTPKEGPVYANATLQNKFFTPIEDE